MNKTRQCLIAGIKEKIMIKVFGMGLPSGIFTQVPQSVSQRRFCGKERWDAGVDMTSPRVRTSRAGTQTLISLIPAQLFTMRSLFYLINLCNAFKASKAAIMLHMHWRILLQVLIWVSRSLLLSLTPFCLNFEYKELFPSLGWSYSDLIIGADVLLVFIGEHCFQQRQRVLSAKIS